MTAPTNTCQYRKIKVTGYETTWRTACGHTVEMAVPIEVGFSFAPDPNEDGRIYCPYCGKKIELAKKTP